MKIVVAVVLLASVMVECRPTSNITTSGEHSQDENSVLVSPDLVSPELELPTEVAETSEKIPKVKNRNQKKSERHETFKNSTGEPSKVEENAESSSGDLDEGDGSLEDDEGDDDVTTTSKSPGVAITTHVHNTTSSVCANAKCSSNKVCVEDDSFKPGYRCCKKKNCNSMVGRYCLDDPMILSQRNKNFSRKPEFENKRHFKPNNTIWVMHNGLTLYVMKCQMNGEWKSEPPYEIPLRPDPFNRKDSKTTTTVAKDDDSDSNSDPVQESQFLKVVVKVLICSVVLCVSAFAIKVGRDHYYRIRKQNSASEGNFKRQQPAPMPDLTSSSVSIDDFHNYVAERHKDNDFLFLQEFQNIQAESAAQHYTTQASNLRENIDKNRYNNIVAYDHTRVHLKESKKHASHFDYINANYVSGFTGLQDFIACQGPLPSTFSDFWEMVWNNNVNTLVMVTNLVENGRRKCDQYWPTEGKETYKHITVSHKHTEVFAHYTVRSFIIKNNKITKMPTKSSYDRKVVQYHYTQWPDHGTPDYLLPVLSFVHASSFGEQQAPIVIHCSAGVGRTGTYIAIQSMIQMLKTTGSVNVPTFLRHIRTQRNLLVQTQDQYIFVHDAILEYIKVGNTEVSRKELLSYYNLLLKNNSWKNKKDEDPLRKPKNKIEKQFEHMKRYLRGNHGDTSYAQHNSHKNREGAVVPVYKTAVKLHHHHCMMPNKDNDEYINASYLQGYRSSKDYIVTQVPLETTRKDFWQLVWDANCSTIVTLGDQQWDNETDNFWPSIDQSSQFSSFKVTFSQKESQDDVIIRSFVLEATKDDYVLMVRQFHIKLWNRKSPSNENKRLVARVSKYSAGKEGSTIVMCRNGGTPSGQFCCWSSIQQRLDAENRADVYQCAVMACQMRPGVFSGIEDLWYLYEAAVVEAKSKMSSTGGHASAVAKQQSNNSSPDLVRHNCDVTKEEEITLLGLKKS